MKFLNEEIIGIPETGRFSMMFLSMRGEAKHQEESSMRDKRRVRKVIRNYNKKFS